MRKYNLDKFANFSHSAAIRTLHSVEAAAAVTGAAVAAAMVALCFLFHRVGAWLMEAMIHSGTILH